MTDLALAFQKAGLPTASVAFAAACHDLARLALNKQPDPERAVAVALGMMSGNIGFRARLVEFLAEVASERPGKSKSDGEALGGNGAQAPGSAVARLSDPNGDAVDHPDGGADGAHLAHVPASSLPSDGVGHLDYAATGDQTRSAPPSESRLRALARTKEVTASAYGFYITERQGSRTPIEQIEVSRLESLCMMTGRRTMASMVENYTLRALQRRMPAWSADGTRVRDVFSAPEITDAIESARSSVSDMLAMSKERRLEARP